MPATTTRHGDTAMAANGKRSIEANHHVRALQPAHGQGRPSQSRPLPIVPGPRVWALADLVASGAILAYVLSRTIGLPTDTLDIGNWNCALGTADISTETLIVLLAAWRMQPQRLLLGPAYRNSVSAEPKITASADSAG
jgi:hypothetical protein